MKEWQQRFYKSKQWRSVRTWVINRDKWTCKECGNVIVDSPVVHHVIELTEENYTDPEISLNPDLLETLDHDCHDIRHRRFIGAEKDTIVDDNLNIDYTRR